MHQALKVCQPFKRSIVDDVVASVVIIVLCTLFVAAAVVVIEYVVAHVGVADSE